MLYHFYYYHSYCSAAANNNNNISINNNNLKKLKAKKYVIVNAICLLFLASLTIINEYYDIIFFSHAPISRIHRQIMSAGDN